jgi:short subunit dehydrogenase-like uncharacterized protein
MSSERLFDVVLFGATGFTGALVADYLAQCGEAEAGRLRWALAGRSRAKLEAVRARLAAKKPALANLPLLIADVADQSSLDALAAQARVVITTVGPYVRYGEGLVKACAELGTDYVDLTGEPAFVDAMTERYQARAQASGARIVHACGFDSIPHDLGAYYTLKALRARMRDDERDKLAVSIEGFVRAKGDASGGTWHSLVNALANARADEAARRKREKVRKVEGDGRRVRGAGGGLVRRSELGLWGLPMPTIDPQMVLASASARPEYGPDFRYGHYLGLRHLVGAAGVIGVVGSLFALAQLGPTRKLLLKLKDPGEGPDEATRKKSWFSVTFLGKAGPYQVVCEVRGGDPGYEETAKMLAESALCLAFDRAELAPRFGMVTTAAVMGDPLLARLQRAGLSFSER